MTTGSTLLWYWLVDYYALATCVLAAAALATAAIKQPVRRLTISWSGLAGLIALLVFGALPGWPRTSLVTPPVGEKQLATKTVSPVSVAKEPVHDSSVRVEVPVEVSPHATAVSPLAPAPPALAASAKVVAPASDTQPKRAAAPGKHSPTWSAVIVALFLAGSVVMVGWLALGYWKVAGLLRRTTPAPKPVTELLARVVAAGRTPPRLLVSDALPQPVALGVLRPTIILPERFLSREPDSGLEAVLAHEWAHVRNRDLWLLALLRLLLPVLYAHPGYWWLRRQTRDDQEAMADAVAAGGLGPVRYAEVLLSWSTFAPGRPPLASVGSVALFERSSQIKWRIVMLLDRSMRVETSCPARWRIALRSATAAVVLGISLFTLRPVIKAEAGPAANSQEAANAALAKTEDAPMITSKVVGPDGKPFAGAQVYLTRAHNTLKPRSGVPRLLATTDANGVFQCPLPPLQAQRREDQIVAVAPGYGPAVSDWSKLRPDTVLQLAADDVPLRGRVLDIQGRPVPRASITVVGLLWPNSGKLDDWLEKLKVENAAYSAQHLTLGFWASHDIPHFFPQVASDADGRFTIQGLGRERIAALLISGPAIETRFEYAATRAMPAVKCPAFQRQPVIRDLVYFGANFDVVAGPCLEVVGAITDKDSGKPIPGVTVETSALFGNPHRTHYTTTDSQGRYHLSGIPLKTTFGDHQDLLASVEDGPAYVPTILNLPTESPAGPLTVDLQLKRGVLVRGRVVDKTSGRGVRANLSYYILADNPNLASYPHYGTIRAASPFGTDEDGSFKLVVMPGPGVIGARAGNEHYRLAVGADAITGAKRRDDVFNSIAAKPQTLIAVNYHTLAAINPKRDDEVLKLELALDHGRTVTGTVIDPDGKPLAGTRIEGLQDYFRQWSYQPLASGEFTIEGLGPEGERELLVLHTEKNLVGAYIVKPDERGPITVKLEPGAILTGRIVDTGGMPVPRTELTCDMPYGDKSHTYGSLPKPIRTDKDGRFRVGGLVAGRKYSFHFWKGSTRYDLEGAQDLILARGQTKDLGDVTINPTR
jgi:beta-lactamase regulating signal transducer with metallopeptidase domain